MISLCKRRGGNGPQPPEVQRQTRPKKEKGPTRVGPVAMLLANRPDPDDPGGLGAEESGAERTGPTQDYLVATQRGGRLAEAGRYYDSANDPVTACFRSWVIRGDITSRSEAGFGQIS